MNVLIFLGPPGSGKGTQARFLGKKYGVPVIGMGDLLREEINKNTPLGQEIQDIIHQGNFPAWPIIESVLHKAIEVIKGSWVIFDGVPRNKNQALHIDAMADASGYHIAKVIFLDVPQSILIERLSQRVYCVSCGMTAIMHSVHGHVFSCSMCSATTCAQRHDDREDVITHRLDLYSDMVEPLIKHYEEKKLLQVIDGALSIDTISTLVAESVQNFTQENRSHANRVA